MAAISEEIVHDFAGLGIRQYKSGKVERDRTSTVPASLDPVTGVESRDVVINADIDLSVRIYVPKSPEGKLPLLVYFHGGGFCIESAFSPTYHPFCNALASTANVVIVSVDYRLAPENPIPVPYEDSWEAIKWVISKNDTWLSEHADFGQIFFAGDSAGANIAHHMAIRAGSEGLPGLNLVGIVLIHPYFWGKDAIEGETNDVNLRMLIEKLWQFVCPVDSGLGLEDPFINPILDQKFPNLGCGRILVFVAEKDMLTPRGWDYYKKLKASEWKGEVEILEAKGETHVFHLFAPDSNNAKDLVKSFGLFLNHGKM